MKYTMKKFLYLITKHLSMVNLIVGILGLITVFLIKYYGIALYIINSFGFANTTFNEYIITGFFGLITRLGLKGIVEEGYTTLFMTATIPLEGTGAPDSNPISKADNTGSSSGSSGTNNTTGSTSGNSPINNTTDSASGNSLTNNTTGTGSSATNTEGYIEPDTNPAPYPPRNDKPIIPTEAERYNADQGALNLFNIISFRSTYLDFIKGNLLYPSEYGKLKSIFEAVYKLEKNIDMLEEECKKLDKNSYISSEKLKRYKSRIEELYEKKEQLKKEHAPNINMRPLNKFQNDEIP